MNLQDLPGNQPIPWAGLAADAQRQGVPIGGIIDWDRPSTAVPVPTGFEICDGHVVPAGSHEFRDGSGNIIAGTYTTPDLRNKFTLGADITAAHASAGNPTTAPGIRGQGGSHVANLAHTHTVAAHTHGITSDGSHTHTVNAHSHTVNSHTHATMLPLARVTGSGDSHLDSAGWLAVLDPTDSRMDDPNTDSHFHSNLTGNAHARRLFPSGSGTGGYVDDVVGGTAMDTYSQTTTSTSPGTSNASPGTDAQGAHSHGGATSSSSPGTDSQLSAATDIRPQYVGTLKIVKVARS